MNISSDDEEPTVLPNEIEQDQFSYESSGPNDLPPSYNDLVADHGPNSRFGRWRGWIEKRAAERYGDLTPEIRARQRARGWGNDTLDDLNTLQIPGQAGDTNIPIIINQPPTPGPATTHQQLHIRTDVSSAARPPNYDDNSNTGGRDDLSPPSPTPFVGESLAPAHLTLHNFGSRFLPHAQSTIRCAFPLPADRLVLLGHDDGLSVIDMFPREWGDSGLEQKGPDEAQARIIWEGEAVYQMSLLEIEETGGGTPQGVVLALVGPSPSNISASPRDSDSVRTLRMYSLASLASLATWAVAQKGAHPIDLGRQMQRSQTPVKKHRAHNSLKSSLKSLVVESTPSTHTASPLPTQFPFRPSPGASKLSSPSVSAPPAIRQDSGSSHDSSWDIVEDLPLRWATDFVPLASAGSKLLNNSVYSYALLHNDSQLSLGSTLLAVVAKSSIFLYESAKGERAFRFVKEFYTPLQARHVTFVDQTVQSSLFDSTMTTTHSRRASHMRLASADVTMAAEHHNRRSRSASAMNPSKSLNYGSQRSLFVVFEKKAGTIRLADAAVGEVDITDEPSRHSRSRASFDGSYMTASAGSKGGHWIVPVRAELPLDTKARSTYHHHGSATFSVYLLTRGRCTYIMPAPLPASISTAEAIHMLSWESAPSHVSARVCHRSPPADQVGAGQHQHQRQLPPLLQLIGLGDAGIEVQEFSMSTILSASTPSSMMMNTIDSKGKGKSRLEEDSTLPIRMTYDLGGDTGFLCDGGHWHLLNERDPVVHLTRSYSLSSDYSAAISLNSFESDELRAKMQMEQGIYAWCRKTAVDYRLFWLGGSGDASTAGQSLV